MDQNKLIEQLGSMAEALRKRFRLKSLSLFGSFAQARAREDSDLDILVEFEGTADFDRYMDLKFELERALSRRVDLVTHNALRPEMREGIEREAVRLA